MAELPNVRKKIQKPHDPRDLSLRWREEFFRLRNWIDFFRAGAGGYAIVHACVEVTGKMPPYFGLKLLAAKAVVLMVAVIVQTLRIESGRHTLVAPVFFLFGLSFVLIGWMPALFAIIMVWVINRTLPTVGIFLFVFAGLQAAFTLALGRNLPMAVLAAVLTWLPVLWSAATRRRLERMAKPRMSGRE